ncbi:Trypsin Inhibitor like cysteine rich domain protein [Trichostrongylus colubriformis]|uniref:Trypsin Inhibitor like cysteine rich domain protein n=1 Tax=Trichostrongylus colubriformis TaxID=6319 RepID=A0AAN8FV38_TRICO
MSTTWIPPSKNTLIFSDSHCGTNTTITRPPRFNDKQCGQNEEYTDCVPHCETSCRGIQECADKTNATCTPGCTCKPGYRHNGLRKCVLPRHCYLAPGCKDNETWSKCSTCERKCGVESQTCSLCYSGCACNDGYARNSSNICTRIEKCA